MNNAFAVGYRDARRPADSIPSEPVWPALAVTLPGEIERRQEDRDRAVAAWRGVNVFHRPATGAERNWLLALLGRDTVLPALLSTEVVVRDGLRLRRWPELHRDGVAP